jgi:cytochrome P450
MDLEGGGPITTEEQRQEELGKCLAYFTRLWNERVNAPPSNDLISMMAHSPATRNMQPSEFLGNLVLLIVGGNDTTRNSISGGLLALLQNPGEFAKLRANPDLIATLVPRSSAGRRRWHTCAAPRWPMPNWAASRSRRAIVS